MGKKRQAEPSVETVLDKLRAVRDRDEDEACQLMRDGDGVPMTRQYLWQICARPPRRPISFRMFARAVARLNLGTAGDPLRATLELQFPDEFRPAVLTQPVNRPASTD